MKKKFNLYCGLLIAAIVFGIGLTMFETGYRMYQSGKKGWKLAEKDHMKGVKRDPSWGINLMNRLTPVEMMPKGELLIGMNVNDSIVNLKTGEKMPMMTVQSLVLPENGQNRMRVMQGISLIGGGLIIVFLVAFIKLVIAVNKGHLFEKSMETQLAWGGWSVLAMYVLGWVSTLYNYFCNVELFDFEAYDITILQTPDLTLLYSAFGMPLVGQTFKLGRTLNEEQELPI